MQTIGESELPIEDTSLGEFAAALDIITAATSSNINSKIKINDESSEDALCSSLDS
jgi:hypothetical protein